MSTVFRVEKNREFVVMSNRFLRNKEMSLKAKGLLALCLSLPEDWDYSMNGLVAICKENITSVRSGLKELEKHGHLKINKTKNDKGRFVYEYVIFESPYIENLPLEKLPMENLPVDNHRQQSTKKESIKEQSIEEENLYIELEEILHSQIEDRGLQMRYRDYIEMRKSINAPLTPRGLKMLITRCINLSHNNLSVQKLMVDNATMNEWKNVYRPKDQEIEAVLNATIKDHKSFFGL